ncbi:50S ribosomal protein L24 [Spirochaeta cellobiosiphila]|uniref:50S ribosomal protein L24 n=1 Tax=Spirochaeta cellobiosiphila TaxID=504483 RepID=UPI0004028634|nr:50S ribosomal protein L24 [Spirochaeta cellobiosiphila]
MAVKTKLKKNDMVKVLSGKDKGKTGKILKIDREKERVVVEGINVVKKTVKPKSAQEKGGIIEIEAALHISNVALMTKKGEPTRIGFKTEKGKKVRFSKKTGDVL